MSHQSYTLTAALHRQASRLWQAVVLMLLVRILSHLGPPANACDLLHSHFSHHEAYYAAGRNKDNDDSKEESIRRCSDMMIAAYIWNGASLTYDGDGLFMPRGSLPGLLSRVASSAPGLLSLSPLGISQNAGAAAICACTPKITVCC